MVSAVIEAANLCRRFGKIVAVRDLSFSVEAGEIFGFLGHNGAGKTTTVRLMNGVLAADGGRLRVLGLDPVSQGRELRSRTGILTESPSLDERLSGWENLTVYAHLYGVPVDQVENRTEELLARFDLSDRAADKVRGYSKGMKQRLALARALIHWPELLFLDEPTAGLDPVAAREVHGLIRELRKAGRTILLCTHNLIEAQRLCDRVAVIRKGELMALGSVAELSQRIGGTQEVEIEVKAADRPRAVTILRERLGEDHVHEERGVVVCIGVDRNLIPSLIDALRAGAIGVYRVSPREPSLEEVYFGLYGPVEE